VWIGVVTLFPDMFKAISEFGITRRAVQSGVLNLEFWDPREFTSDKHQTVDDRPYGGGPGMLMKVQPLRDAIKAAKNEAGEGVKVIYLSPQGRPLDQAGVHEIAKRDKIVLVAGRYEGVDERILETCIDEEWSIGDYVLSGGELGAMVVIDAVTRWLPGALGHDDSAQQDSFNDGLLDCPHYTRPETLDGQNVPDVLMSGHHEEIRRWRLKQSLGRTWLKRPDLLEQKKLDAEQCELLEQFKQAHQEKVLMHTQ
jgi:tRNA (guanine37-N1)-methyltransferase